MWHHHVGEGLERVGRDLESDRDILPRGLGEASAEAGRRGKADGVQRAVHPTPSLAQRVAHGGYLGGVGDVELQHLGLLGQLPGRALRQGQTSTGAGEDDLGALLLGVTSDSEG